VVLPIETIGKELTLDVGRVYREESIRAIFTPPTIRTRASVWP